MALQSRHFTLPKGAEPSNEALIIKLPMPIFLGIADINDHIRRQNGHATKFILTLFEYGPSCVKYAVYTPQGILIKKYKFRDDLEITFDELISFMQFYHQVKAYKPDYIINILDIFVEPTNSDGSKIKCSFRTAYDESIDVSGGASHISSGNKASFRGMDKANFIASSYQHPFVTKGEETVGFAPLRTN